MRHCTLQPESTVDLLDSVGVVADIAPFVVHPFVAAVAVCNIHALQPFLGWHPCSCYLPLQPLDHPYFVPFPPFVGLPSEHIVAVAADGSIFVDTASCCFHHVHDHLEYLVLGYGYCLRLPIDCGSGCSNTVEGLVFEPI